MTFDLLQPFQMIQKKLVCKHFIKRFKLHLRSHSIDRHIGDHIQWDGLKYLFGLFVYIGQ
jgi:hypothetical protein